MRNLLLLLVLAPSVALAQAPAPFRPLPDLTDADVMPPNHVLTPKNRDTFVASEVIPVGDNLVVVLPVQQGVAFRWRLEPPKDPNDLAAFNKVFLFLNPPKPGRMEDLRSLRKGFEVQPAGGPLGGVDALQVFQFRVQAAAQGVPIRFRLVDVVNNDAPSDVVFEARISTADRPR